MKSVAGLAVITLGVVIGGCSPIASGLIATNYPKVVIGAEDGGHLVQVHPYQRVELKLTGHWSRPDVSNEHALLRVSDKSGLAAPDLNDVFMSSDGGLTVLSSVQVSPPCHGGCPAAPEVAYLVYVLVTSDPRSYDAQVGSAGGPYWMRVGETVELVSQNAVGQTTDPAVLAPVPNPATALTQPVLDVVAFRATAPGYAEVSPGGECGPNVPCSVPHDSFFVTSDSPTTVTTFTRSDSGRVVHISGRHVFKLDLTRVDGLVGDLSAPNVLARVAELPEQATDDGTFFYYALRPGHVEIRDGPEDYKCTTASWDAREQICGPAGPSFTLDVVVDA